MLEVFDNASAGSGQIDPDIIEQTFDIAQGTAVDDARKIQALAKLNSFDVYSLRIRIRSLGIVVDDHEHLRLPAGKRSELTQSMLGFTRPLVRQITGDNETSIADLLAMIALFASPA